MLQVLLVLVFVCLAALLGAYLGVCASFLSRELQEAERLAQQEGGVFDLDCRKLAKQVYAGLSDPYHPLSGDEALALLEGTIRDYTGVAFDAGCAQQGWQPRTVATSRPV